MFHQTERETQYILHYEGLGESVLNARLMRKYASPIKYLSNVTITLGSFDRNIEPKLQIGRPHKIPENHHGV